MTVEVTTHPDTFNWLLENFVRTTDGVQEAVAVSADGLLIARSDGLDPAEADRLAALVSGLASLSRSASHQYRFDGLKLIMIEMRRGFLLVSMIADGSCVAAIADDRCEIALVGYEISILADRAGDLLTPPLISGPREGLTTARGADPAEPLQTAWTPPSSFELRGGTLGGA